MKGSVVSKQPQKINRALDYRFSGWLLAAVVIVLIVSVKFLMT